MNEVVCLIRPSELASALLSRQVMTPGLYHYYVTELAFYWSLMFSQFIDIKRKVSVTPVQCSVTLNRGRSSAAATPC